MSDVALLSKFKVTMLQFGSVFISIGVVAFLNLNFRFHKEASNSAAGADSKKKDKKFQNQYPDITKQHARNEKDSWRARLWMVPSPSTLSFGFLVALFLFFLILTAMINTRFPDRLHTNPTLSALKHEARQNCKIFQSVGLEYNASVALLKDPALFKLRKAGEFEKAEEREQFPTISKEVAIVFEKVIKHLGPMASIIPLVLFFFYRLLFKPSFLSSSHATSHTWWSMFEELSNLMITVVTAISTVSFMFFHLYVDGQRTVRCVHTSGHWYTWAVTVECFLAICVVLYHVAFGKPKEGEVVGYSATESKAMSTELTHTGKAVAARLFYLSSAWFALYSAFTALSLAESQTIYHDVIDSIDGLLMARYQILLAAAVAIIATYADAQFRRLQLERAWHALNNIEANAKEVEDDEEEAEGEVEQKKENKHKPVSSGSANKQNKETPETPDAPDAPAFTPSSSVDSSAGAGAGAGADADADADSDSGSAPPPPPPPPGPPPSYSDWTKPKINVVPRAPSSSSSSSSSSSVRSAGSGLPFTAANLANAARGLKKSNAGAAKESIKLDSAMPPKLRGNMILELTWSGARKRLSQLGAVDMKKAVLDFVNADEAQLRTLAEKHKINYHFDDLTLLLLAVHFAEAHSKLDDLKTGSPKCNCSNSKSDESAGDSDEFTD